VKSIMFCISVLSIPLFAMDTTGTNNLSNRATSSTVDTATRGNESVIGTTLKQLVGRVQAALDVLSEEEEIMREGTESIIQAIRHGSPSKKDSELTVITYNAHNSNSNPSLPDTQDTASAMPLVISAPQVQLDSPCGWYAECDGYTLKMGLTIDPSRPKKRGRKTLPTLL